MGKLMKNGVDYSGFHTSDASKISFDPSGTGLESQNVSGALTEINSRLNTISDETSQMSELIVEISDLIEYDENLLNNDSAKDNTTWRRTYGIPSTILQVSSNNNIAFDVIQIEKGKKYCATVMRNSVSYILYGSWNAESGAYEGTYGTVQNLLSVAEYAPFEFVAENDGYLFCTMSAAYGDKTKAMVCVGKLPATFIPYGKKTNAKFRSDIVKTTITVEKDGSGDYTSIKDAIDNANDYDTIKIGCGTFVEELTIRDKFLYIIGSGIDCTIITNSNNTYENPPLEIAKGVVSNLTVYAKREDGASKPSQGYTPYAVHIDWVESCDTTLTFENCKLVSDWNASAGVGLRKGFILTFRNCILEATDNTSTNGALYFHDANSANTYGVGKIVIDGCRLHSKSAISVMPASSGVVTDNNSVYMSWYNSIAWSDINGKGNGAIGVGRPIQGDGWRLYNNFFLTADSFGNNVTLFNA